MRRIGIEIFGLFLIQTQEKVLYNRLDNLVCETFPLLPIENVDFDVSYTKEIRQMFVDYVKRER
jgi:hypothetical protein